MLLELCLVKFLLFPIKSNEYKIVQLCNKKWRNYNYNMECELYYDGERVTLGYYSCNVTSLEDDTIRYTLEYNRCINYCYVNASHYKLYADEEEEEGNSSGGFSSSISSSSSTATDGSAMTNTTTTTTTTLPPNYICSSFNYSSSTSSNDIMQEHENEMIRLYFAGRLHKVDYIQMYMLLFEQWNYEGYDDPTFTLQALCHIKERNRHKNLNQLTAVPPAGETEEESEEEEEEEEVDKNILLVYNPCDDFSDWISVYYYRCSWMPNYEYEEVVRTYYYYVSSNTYPSLYIKETKYNKDDNIRSYHKDSFYLGKYQTITRNYKVCDESNTTNVCGDYTESSLDSTMQFMISGGNSNQSCELHNITYWWFHDNPTIENVNKFRNPLKEHCEWKNNQKAIDDEDTEEAVNNQNNN